MSIRLFYCAAVLLNAVHAQTAKEAAVLLPKPISLSGIVTDTKGTPLADASVNHTGFSGQMVKTDAAGRFAIYTRAPAIVFRKDGFNGRYYRVERDAVIEIKLEPVLRSLKACPSAGKCLSLKGFMSEFCLPKVRGINATGQHNDIDYAQRQFLLQTPTGRKGIQHAAGPLWGSGLPLDEDVWSAVEYSETEYRDLEGFAVLDARGKSSNGECWRVLGRAFETASYRKVSPDEASLLDKVLDGVCLRTQPSR